MSYKQKRSRKPIELETLRLRATDAFKAVEEMILADNVDPNQRINAINSFCGLMSRYTKLTEVHNLEKRIQKLEEENETK